ncbi:hypothetical protein ACP4OV_020527 [Aristida adscensionis]
MESHTHHTRRCVAEDEDRLSGLPDDLLHSILRGLPLRQAARTSALSRRWPRQWLHALASSPVLDFTGRDVASGRRPVLAAATVARCLRLHAEYGGPLEVFRTPSGGSPPPWAGAEVDLTPTAGSGGTAFLELPGAVFLAESSLERLALGPFGLRAVPSGGAAGLAGLRSLLLSRAGVTDEALRGVLAGCRALELLSLRSCHLLTSVRVAGEKLRVLEVARCPAVRELHVAAPALESFAVHGHIVYWSDGDEDYAAVAVEPAAMPPLRDACLSHVGFTDGRGPYDHENAYFFFMDCVARARILTLCPVGLEILCARQTYDEATYVGMPNVQELQLLLASLDEDDDLGHV